MAAQALVSCSCTSVSAKEQLGSAFWGAPSSSNNPIISGSGYDDAQVRCFGRRARPPLPGVRMAISRKKKEETVDRAKQQLEGAYLVAGIKYAGLTVKQFQQLRKSLPQDTTLMVAKNKLIGNAFSLHCLLRLHWFWTQSIKSTQTHKPLSISSFLWVASIWFPLHFIFTTSVELILPQFGVLELQIVWFYICRKTWGKRRIVHLLDNSPW